MTAKLMETKLPWTRTSPKANVALEVLDEAEEDLEAKVVEEEAKVDSLAETA